MKKILIFSLAYYPRAVGGAEVAIKEITDRIDSSKIEFHMVCLRFDAALPKVEQVGNVLVHRIGPVRLRPSPADMRRWPLHFGKHVFQILAVWEAHKLHKQYRYDGIWAMMAHSCGIPAALFRTLHSDVPYVLTLQEGDPPGTIERMMRPVWPLFKRAFTKPTIVQAISTYLALWAKRMGSPCPIVVIPNGVDTARFSECPTEEMLRYARTLLRKEDGEVLLITTSRMVPKNAIDVVIAALPALPDNVRFVVCGDGPDRGVLQAQVKAAGLEGRVSFMGLVGHNELPAILHACDIFIRPSRSEGMGNSFIEAMAAGLPVVATQVGGIADFLFDAKRNPDKPTTGWAVSVDAPEEIAAAVRDITSNREETLRVTQNALALVRAQYDWDHIAARMQREVFERVRTV